jgi:hypothetical protein
MNTKIILAVVLAIVVIAAWAVNAHREVVLLHPLSCRYDLKAHCPSLLVCEGW